MTFDAPDIADLRRRTSMKWSKYGPDVLPMWVAEMDFSLAEPIRRVLHELIDRGDTGYPNGAAHEEAFARFARRRYGWRVDPSLASTVPDVMTGVEFALHMLTEPGEAVAFLVPAYPPFFVAVESTRRAVVEVPLAGDAERGWTLDGDALARALRDGARAILLCNPHNPTGRRLTRAELGTVAALADHHGVPVISDEIHAPLILDREAGEHIPFPTLDGAAARCVCLHSASKGWNLPGLKAALLVAGAAVRARLDARVLEELSERAGIAGVAAGAAAFDEAETWLEAAVAHIAANHRIVRERLPGALPGARVTRAEATYLAWLDLRDVGVKGEPADVLLERAGVALVAGPNFGKRYRGFARMNVGTSRRIVQQAIDRIGAARQGRLDR